jgi:hypothetical protein
MESAEPRLAQATADDYATGAEWRSVRKGHCAVMIAFDEFRVMIGYAKL